MFNYALDCENKILDKQKIRFFLRKRAKVLSVPNRQGVIKLRKEYIKKDKH